MRQLTNSFAAAVKPKLRLTPAEHAEKTLYLSNKVTDYEGLINLDRSPYLRFPLEVLDMPSVWDVRLCVATQWGKSTLLYAWLNYIIDMEPGPTLFVMSTRDQMEDVSRQRLQVIIKDSPSMAKHVRRLNSMTYEFDNMTMYTGWNSVASVSAHPCKYIICDETHSLGKSIPDKAMERGKSKTGMKFLEATSPSTEQDNIWQAMGLQRDLDAEEAAKDDSRDHLPIRRYKSGNDCVVFWYHVECPKCNRLQQFFPDRIWWPKDCPIRDLTWKAKYLCSYCDYMISDREKPAMVRGGAWRNELAEVTQPGQRNGFHSNSIYSLMGDRCTFGEICAAWIRVRHYPEKGAAFLHNWCAIPVESNLEETSAAVSFALDASDKSGFRRGSVPDGVTLITAGFDLHKNKLVGAVWGWSDAEHYRQGWLLDWQTWPCDMDTDPDGVREIMKAYRNTPFKTDRGDMWPLIVGVDSGYRTSDAYRFAMAHSWMRVVKGKRGEVRIPEEDEPQAYYTKKKQTKTADNQVLPGAGVMLYAINTGTLKKEFYSNLAAGIHRLPVDVDQDVIDHLNSEELIRDVKNGKKYYRKKKMRDVRNRGDESETPGTIQNHYLDATIYARVAAEILCGNEDVGVIGRHYYKPKQSKGGYTQL